MMTYRKLKDSDGVERTGVIQRNDGDCIPFDPANTDYQQFKAQINADEAQLEDAEGNMMTAEEAKQFVSTLP